MLTPPICTVDTVLVGSLRLCKLNTNSITVALESLKLTVIPFHADLLSAIETVTVLLARQHRIVMHAETEDCDVSNPLTQGIEVSLCYWCVLSDLS